MNDRACREAFSALLVGLCLTLGSAGPARATAIYSSNAGATLTLSGFQDSVGNPILAPTGLTIGTSAFVSASDSFQSGTASASKGGSATGDGLAMVPGDEIVLSSSSSGNATGPLGQADSFLDTESLIEIDNESDQDVTVLFHFSYSWDLAASADDLTNERALADFFIDLSARGLLHHPDNLVDITALLAPGTLEASDSTGFDFSVALVGFDSSAVSLALGTSGSAEASGTRMSVPEPGSLALVLPGLLLALVRLRLPVRKREAITSRPWPGSARQKRLRLLRVMQTESGSHGP